MQRVIKRHRVRTGPDAVRARTRPTSADVPVAPRDVRLIRVDDRVQAIEVTCHCGEKMVIEIEYESPVLSEEAQS